ncbi:glycosyltransferase [Desulfosporosinus sp. FKA]|uniref:tetratricopeptide repeat-containing glycosyltransferase family 2 protein n=1 Tax=Desulfosporosinus sp. FKA TaxID=1969834 RepID=UPI000B4A4883|nr:glycosyltransferase [Desulfosporosinus sp. FKA]
MNNSKITISLCMIVRDEEQTISRCLDSVTGIPDEIIIVDTGSIDQTKEIAQKYTNFVFDFEWIDDFAEARNFAFSKANMDYILWLDADDIISGCDRDKFLILKKSLDPLIDVVNMPYILDLDEYETVAMSLRRNRLVKRSKNFQWFGAVHEFLKIDGYVMNSDVCVTHLGIRDDPNRNLRIFEKQMIKGNPLSGRDLFYIGNELLSHRLYHRAIEIYQKALQQEDLWVENKLSACQRLAGIYHHLEDKDNELQFLFKSFEYDVPRAEFCCHLGNYFLENGQYEKSIFWYNLATKLERPGENWGPAEHACWTWLPHIQLCLCYDRLGNYSLAYKHNEIARGYRPQDPRILYNKKYFEDILSP